MFRPTILLAATIVLSACNDPGFTGVPSVRTATASEVAACAYVIDLRVRPGVYGPLAQQGLEYSRNQVLDSARQAGANTVVFDRVEPGTMVTEVRATAYRC